MLVNWDPHTGSWSSWRHTYTHTHEFEQKMNIQINAWLRNHMNTCIYIYISAHIIIPICIINTYQHTYITLSLPLPLPLWDPVGLPTWRGHLFGLTASTCTVFPADARPAHGGHRPTWGSRDPSSGNSRRCLKCCCLSGYGTLGVVIWRDTTRYRKLIYIYIYELIVKDFYG